MCGLLFVVVLFVECNLLIGNIIGLFPMAELHIAIFSRIYKRGATGQIHLKYTQISV